MFARNHRQPAPHNQATCSRIVAHHAPGLPQWTGRFPTWASLFSLRPGSTVSGRGFSPFGVWLVGAALVGLMMLAGGCSFLPGGGGMFDWWPGNSSNSSGNGDDSPLYYALRILRIGSGLAMAAGIAFAVIGAVTLSQGRPGSIQSIITGLVVLGCGVVGFYAAHLLEQYLFWIALAGGIVLAVSTYETWRDWPAVVRFMRWIGRLTTSEGSA